MEDTHNNQVENSLPVPTNHLCQLHRDIQVSLLSFKDTLVTKSLSLNVSTNNNAPPILGREFENSRLLNLSTHTLSADESNVLSKGLTFCPSPGPPDMGVIHSDFERFFRSLRLKTFFNNSHFSDSQSTSTEDDTTAILSVLAQSQDFSLNTEHPPFDNKKFWPKSNFDPKQVQRGNLDAFIKTVRFDLASDHKIRSPKPNLTSNERKALRDLQQNHSIIIKKADKGSCVVIQDLLDYITECERQLSDERYYEKIPNDYTLENASKVNSLVDQMIRRGSISEKVGKYIKAEKPRTALFYTLPKIHKNIYPPPGRPIVSANNCPTEQISALVDHILRPFVKEIPSHIEDTSDFLRKIKDITVPAGAKLITFDVTSLYTNIDIKEGLQVIKQLLGDKRPGIQRPSNIDVLRMLHLVLTCNNFEFNGEHYLQISGVAMGTKVAPTFATLYMADFEAKFVYTYEHQPDYWFRFLDDIWSLWTVSTEQTEDFKGHINSQRERISLTSDESTESLPFLDVLSILEDGKISTDLYTKKTDTHSYLHFTSAHPSHTLKGGPYSQFLRLRRICSKEETFQMRGLEMIGHYLDRGYPKQILLHAMEKAHSMSREESLAIKPSHTQNENLSDDELYLITQYNPKNPKFSQILAKNWNILACSAQLQHLSKMKVVCGSRRNKNLKDLLVRAKVQTTTTGDRDLQPSADDRLPRCTFRKCKYCPHFDRSLKVTSHSTGRLHSAKVKVDCKSNNLIYLLTCSKCGIQYVGETKRSFGERCYEHFRDAKYFADPSQAPPSWRADKICPASVHFGGPGHSYMDIKVNILELIPKDPQDPATTDYRRHREFVWIHRLRTQEPFGLNDKLEDPYISGK